jgi:hypothetical protein
VWYREIITVSSDITAKHINALCRNDSDFLPIKSGPIQSGHWALKRNIHHAVIHPSDLRPVRPKIQVCLVKNPWFIKIKVCHARKIDKFACQKVRVFINQDAPNDTTKTVMEIKPSGTFCRVDRSTYRIAYLCKWRHYLLNVAKYLSKDAIQHL